LPITGCGESAGSTATDSSGNARDWRIREHPTLGATSLLTRDANSAVTLAAASSQEVTSANAAALNLDQHDARGRVLNYRPQGDRSRPHLRSMAGSSL
jgi:hypothetical protein